MPLGTKRADYNDARYAGAEVEAGGDAVAALDFALGAGFDFVLAPLGLVDERRAACAVGAHDIDPDVSRHRMIGPSSAAGRTSDRCVARVDDSSTHPLRS